MIVGYSRAPIVGTGGNDAFTKILNHFDGNLTDSSAQGFVWTASGNAAVTSAQSKFGGQSLALDGSGDYLTGTFDATKHRWYDTDYTIDMWVYLNSLTNANYCFCHGEATGGDGNFFFGVTSGGKVQFFYWTGSSHTVTGSTTVTLSAWHHIAMTVSGTTIRVFLDGVRDGSATISGSPTELSSPLCVGVNNSRAVNGYIDELRVSKGVARWTADFTLPTRAYF
jgi:hypothetical protein